MPSINQHTFGPGSLESLVLKTWVSKVDNGKRRLTGRLEGTYTVYCGNGWTHEVEVSEQVSAWAGPPHQDEDRDELFETHYGFNDRDQTYNLVNRMVNYALEDFEDPCDDDGEEL